MPTRTQNRKLGNNNLLGNEKAAATNAENGTKQSAADTKPACLNTNGAATKIKHIKNKADQFLRI